MTDNQRDRQLVEDLLARYCWLMDGGDGDGWAALWTSDGKFTGIPEPANGTEQLRAMPPEFHQLGNGKFRHHVSNVSIEQGASADEMAVCAYSTVTNWNEGGALMGFANATFTLVRQDGAWKIKALHADMQA